MYLQSQFAQLVGFKVDIYFIILHLKYGRSYFGDFNQSVQVLCSRNRIGEYYFNSILRFVNAFGREETEIILGRDQYVFCQFAVDSCRTAVGGDFQLVVFRCANDTGYFKLIARRMICRSDTDRIALAVSAFGREHFLNCFFGSGITETYFTFQCHQVAMAIYVDGCQWFDIQCEIGFLYSEREFEFFQTTVHFYKPA